MPPAPRAIPSQVRSRRRFNAICSAAERVLREDGIASCSMASIAAQAGMTPASLYRYFPNVEALLHEVAARQLDDMHARLADALSDLTSPQQAREAVLTAFNAYEVGFRSDRALREIWAGSMALPSLMELNVAASRRNAELIMDKLGRFRAEPMPRERAFLYSHLIGAGVLLLLQVDPAEVDALRDELRQIVVNLLDEQRTDERRRTERRTHERRAGARVADRSGLPERRVGDRRRTDRRAGNRRLRDLVALSAHDGDARAHA